MRFVVAFLSALLLCSAVGCRETRSLAQPATVALSPSAEQVRHAWNADLDSLQRSLERLDSALVIVAASPSEAARARAERHFFDARMAFKRGEFLTAYYWAGTIKRMNGPALPRVEDGEGPDAIFPAEGFQVIEELIHADLDSARAAQASADVRNVLEYLARVQTGARQQLITDDRVFDAAKMEIARVVSLGISGFDSPVALQSLPEAAAALQGVRIAMTAYRDKLGRAEWADLDGAFASAIEELWPADEADDIEAPASNFNDFNRLRFIVHSANPLARALVRARDQLHVGMPDELRAFRMEAATLFDSGAFSAEALAPYGMGPSTPERVALGRALFFDPRLSGDGTRSCASCHDPARAFTDGRDRSVARSQHAMLRNSPTMINAGLQPGAFYDMRVKFLEDQVSDVLGNANEMRGDADVTARVLAHDTAYAKRFAAAFPKADTVRGMQLRLAVADYVRSLQALNSRADRALRGDTTVLHADERLGFNLFMGKARCGTCHFAPLFNGTVPPAYVESEVEVLGVPSTPVTHGAHVDPDSGRFRVTHSLPHMHAFKVPSVRNVELTAPYMHNGVYRTLDEVVDFYNRGGGAGIGVKLPNQTLPRDSLGLSEREMRALVRFMGALTDTAGTTRIK